MIAGGNNLLPLFDISDNRAGAKITRKDPATGTIAVEFKNAGTNVVVYTKWLDLSDGEYFFSGIDAEMSDKVNGLVQRADKSTYAWNKNYRIGTAFDVDSGKYVYRFAIQNNTGAVLTKQVVFHNLMINRGTSPLPFEPYYPLCVYDRTQKDVERVVELNYKYLEQTITDAEKAEWAAGMKGALNISDINRIEENTALLAAFFAVTVNTKKWTTGDIPRESDYQRIRDNVQAVRRSWNVLGGTPATPTQPLNTYQKWNDIEQILNDLLATYNRTMNAYYYIGDELYAGEGIGIL